MHQGFHQHQAGTADCKGLGRFCPFGVVNRVAVRCHWAALESWDCTAQKLKLGPHGTPGGTAGSGRLFHLQLSGFTSVLSISPSKHPFCSFSEGGSISAPVSHSVLWLAWFETLHMCWERHIFIFGGLWGFLRFACSCAMVVCSP